jgi:hypothetical protein
MNITRNPHGCACVRPIARSAVAVLAIGFTAGCSSSSENGGTTFGGPGAGGSGAQVPGGSAASGGNAGTSPGAAGVIHVGGSPGGAAGNGSFEACTGIGVQGERVVNSGPLDVYLIFDRTASMGEDCAFTPGAAPPVNSKACYATYAVAQYFMSVDAADDTRLAFQFMSLDRNDCNGGPYGTPLIDMTPLPVNADHALVRAISDETFEGGLGTHIEGAIRGISSYTLAHDRDVGAPAGRTTIGILITDGDPNGCEENVSNLADLVANHLSQSGGAVRMFFIGETGATLRNLETYAVEGGADPHTDFCGNGPSPCHYWDVGDGKPEAFASAMASIVGQATVAKPLPCTFKVPAPPSGQKLDPNLVNVNFTVGANTVGIYRVGSNAECDATAGGWYYENPAAPSQIHLCPASCSTVGMAANATIQIEFGCASETPPVR